MIRDADNQMSSTDLGLFQFIIFLFYALLSLTYELVIFILILILFDSLKLIATSFQAALFFISKVFPRSFHSYEDEKQYFHEHTFEFL